MKRGVLMMVLLAGLCFSSRPAHAQADELAELALDIEKLAQLKQILTDLKKGYEILSGGYNTILNISKGNFELHKLFLDGLWAINPAIKNYQRVADIIDCQLRLVKEYKAALSRFKNAGAFTIDELNYIAGVYDQLFAASLKNLDGLATILTANKLRMNDAERIAAINALYEDMQDKLQFLRVFNSQTTTLALQRTKEASEVNGARKLAGPTQ